MSEPFRGEPGTNPPRHMEPKNSNKQVGWTVGILGTLVLLGILFFSIATPIEKADNPAVTTTGQSTRQPARPLPANPNLTAPQRNPSEPAPTTR